RSYTRAAIDEADMREIRNRTFTDEKIACDGFIFVNCRFDGCILVLSSDDASFPGTSCVFCDLQGAGWPQHIQELNAHAILQRPPHPIHEPEVAMTKAERRAQKYQSTGEFIAWLRSKGFQ